MKIPSFTCTPSVSVLCGVHVAKFQNGTSKVIDYQVYNIWSEQMTKIFLQENCLHYKAQLMIFWSWTTSDLVWSSNFQVRLIQCTVSYTELIILHLYSFLLTLIQLVVSTVRQQPAILAADCRLHVYGLKYYQLHTCQQA